MKITSQGIIDFVEKMKSKPVIENKENMERFHCCIDLTHKLAALMADAEVLPIMSDPTFHHSMTVHMICKAALFEGESLEVLKQIVNICDVFSAEQASGALPYRLGFEVSHIWEAQE